MIVGVDIDGVLAGIHEATLRMLNARHGRDFKKVDILKWDYLQTMYGINAEEVMDAFDKVWTEFDILNVEEPGVQKQLARLQSNCHRVVIVSRRTKPTQSYVCAWLEYMEMPYDDLVFVRSEASKFSFGIDVLIDDAPSMLEEIDGWPGKYLYLRTQPWNVDVYCDLWNVTRVLSLRDAVNHILQGG